MRVWRVEERVSRQGPYYNREKWDPPNGGIASDRHPMPYSDGLNYDEYPNEHRFGFADVSAMKRWFDPKDRSRLVKADFVCRIYEVPKEHVRLGKSQLVFSAAHAKFVRMSRALSKNV